MKKATLILSMFAPMVLLSQQQTGRDAFLRQQAYAEMQRVTGQVDVLQNNFDNLAQRVGRLEGAGGRDQAQRAEIDALKASVAELRREMSRMREEIVRDLASRMAKMQPKDPPPPAPRTVVVKGPTSTYTVENGDNLYFIAKAFNTSVAKLREMNGLKNDRLSVGQKLIVPQVGE